MDDHLRALVTVSIDVGEEGLSETLVKAVTPDNIDIPEGISLEVYGRGKTLTVTVKGDIPTRRLLTLKNTLDDLLSDIEVTLLSLNNIST